MSIRETLTDYAKGDRLELFWKLFFLRQRTASKPLRDVLTFFLYRMASWHGGYIGRDAVIHGRPSLPHGLHGIYISRYASIGTDCRIYQNATIGEVDGKAPHIGNHCLIGAGAVITGGVKIGDFAKIGAGAVVFSDVPSFATAAAQPPRIISRPPGQ
ncbi:MAG: serine acetyltransferase [Oscillospiraceae bacterium]|nr:serine acetyltransferase [Oscillospiraceae bacterium]